MSTVRGTERALGAIGATVLAGIIDPGHILILSGSTVGDTVVAQKENLKTVEGVKTGIACGCI